MNKKLPDEAADYYVALGPTRTQIAVAQHFKVAKRTVAYRAKKEGWLLRAVEADQKARQAVVQRSQDTLEEMQIRHVKTARFLQMRAIEALRSLPIRTESAAVRALDMSIRHERLARGEPGDAADKDVAAVLRETHKRFVTFIEGEDDGK